MKKQVKNKKLSLQKFKVARVEKHGKRLIIGGDGNNDHCTGHGSNGVVTR